MAAFHAPLTVRMSSKRQPTASLSDALSSPSKTCGLSWTPRVLRRPALGALKSVLWRHQNDAKNGIKCGTETKRTCVDATPETAAHSPQEPENDGPREAGTQPQARNAERPQHVVRSQAAVQGCHQRPLLRRPGKVHPHDRVDLRAERSVPRSSQKRACRDGSEHRAHDTRRHSLASPRAPPRPCTARAPPAQRP